MSEFTDKIEQMITHMEVAASALEYADKRITVLTASLRDQFCPRPCNGRPDDFDVGDCVDAGECGCSARAALGAPENEMKP